MPIDEKSLTEAENLLSEKQKILIVPHANVDPDGLSSALACYQLFSSIGKECTVLCPDTFPESLEFLPGYEKLSQKLDTAQDFVVTLNCSKGVEVDKLRYTIEDQSVNIIVTPKNGVLTKKDVVFKEGPLPYDLVIVVDSADLSLLGSLYLEHKEFFGKVPIINVDHHISNSAFGQVQLVSSTSASTTEVLFDWWKNIFEWKEKITPDIATLLLTGLITDTRSFQNPNTTPHSLEVAAELLEYGARQQEIIKFIYKTKPLSTLKIWGRALNGMQVNTKDRIVWSTISKEDLAEMEASSKETHGIIDELLTTIPDADVYILFTEIEEGGMKASMRSSEAVNVSALANKLFGGGGHARAAGFKIKQYENFQMTVLECIQKIVQDINGEKPEKENSMDRKEAEENVPHKDAGSGEIDIVEKLSE